MARVAVQYRYLKPGDTAPNYTYEWRLTTDPLPMGLELTIVDQISEETVEIRQSRKTPGHYVAIPLIFNVPANSTKYKDFVIPDYTNGLDILSVHFDASQIDNGDQAVAGKLLLGKIGVLGAEAAAGATVVTVVSKKGLLKSTLLSGILDEGFNLSFGVENTTDTELNDGTKTELEEYEIKRIGGETDIGGGNASVPITLFTALSGALAANVDVNLVIPFIRNGQPIEFNKGDTYKFGGETFIAGNAPAGKRFRVGFRNKSSTTTKDVRAIIAALY